MVKLRRQIHRLRCISRLAKRPWGGKGYERWVLNSGFTNTMALLDKDFYHYELEPLGTYVDIGVYVLFPMLRMQPHDIGC